MSAVPADTEGGVEEAAALLRHRLPSVPPVAVVVGSGLGALESSLSNVTRIPFEEVPGLPSPSVAGHSGAFVHGRLGGSEILVQAGRFHVYEGHPLGIVAAPVRILASLGVRAVVLTNAAGAIHPHMHPGDVVLIEDVLGVQFRSPLAGPPRRGEDRFPDMSDALGAAPRAVLRDAALAVGLDLREGTYAAVTGPAYETRAEVRMLRRMGADLVGMSTVPEIVVASASGLACAALSLVTNRATGLSTTALSHAEVLETGRRAGERVVDLLREALPRLSDVSSGVPGRPEADQSGEAK